MRPLSVVVLRCGAVTDKWFPEFDEYRAAARRVARSFDTVFVSEGLNIIALPYQAPNANSHAERWVRTAREECLDHLLIWNDAHLLRVLN